MKCSTQQKNRCLSNRKGMTLIEVLVAMAVLMIAIFTFLPLGQTSFQNIFNAGKKIKEGYASVSIMEKLIGNDGANGDYETRTGNIPLEFHAYRSDDEKDDSVIPLQAGVKNTADKKNGLQSINGSALLSTPEHPGLGYSTFICDSVTSDMLAFPTHIADDFVKKQITLYAVGFRFGSKDDIHLEYTDENGNRNPVPNKEEYYTFHVDKKNASVGKLLLCGDNDIINFSHSPLYVTYGNYTISLEIDAPTVIMVGEAAAEEKDKNYYYYVTSGEPIDQDGVLNEDEGEVRIVRKKMQNTGPKSGQNITLNSAMNNVIWMDADEVGALGTGEHYGSYVMCGDNGQIRRFWKNKKTGNYGWDGDNIIAYDNYNGNEVTNESVFATTAEYSYAFTNDNFAAPNADMCLLPKPFDTGATIFNRLYTNTLFTVNAPKIHPELNFYVTGGVLNAEGGFQTYPRKNNFDSTLLDQYKVKDGTYLKKIPAKEATQYADFYHLDKAAAQNNITLTSVSPMVFAKGVQGTGAEHERYPHKPYLLYCGSIPAVMDIWTTDSLIKLNTNGDRTTPWRATLGVAFQDGALKSTRAPYYKEIKNIRWGSPILGYLWNYGATQAGNYALSGICGPENYNPERCKTLWDSLNAAQNGSLLSPLATPEMTFYPLHIGYHQQYLQAQNETEVSVSYLSHPHALSDKPIERSHRDQSPNRRDAYSGVFEWGLDKSITLLDADTINFPDDEGNDRYFSLAVGYYVGGLAYEQQGSKYKPLNVPTVMNNGIVMIRSDFEKDSEDKSYIADQMASMQKESNIFRPFFTTNDYVVRTAADGTFIKNTFDRNVSAGYWRDVYHPLFYSIHGEAYDPDNNPYDYVMGHILQDKRLNCVSWGETWAGRPEAMWGASDGTMMSWYLDETGNKERGNDVDAEFQSYLNLKRASDMHKKYDNRFNGEWKFKQNYVTGTFTSTHEVIAIDHIKEFVLPKDLDDIIDAYDEDDSGWSGDDLTHYPWRDRTKNPMFNNTYLDKCSLQLACANKEGKIETTIQNEQILKKYAFISPLQTVEDVEYANDTWVGVGRWGLSDPVEQDGVTYCGKDAVLYNGPVTSRRGSWVCVRTWLDRSGGTDNGPTDKNSNYIWQAVQVTKQEHVNIEQVSYSNGMWYAMGYYDKNGNGQYDYNSGEHAMMFYARDPHKPCDGTKSANGGWDGGWKLCKTKGSDHTQAYENDGNGNFVPFEIDGINSVASRND